MATHLWGCVGFGRIMDGYGGRNLEKILEPIMNETASALGGPAPGGWPDAIRHG